MALKTQPSSGLWCGRVVDAVTRIRDQAVITEVVGTLFDTIAARFSDRNGGYTRIIKTGRRPGDNAPMVILELVDRVEGGKARKDGAEKKEKAPKAEGGTAAKGKKKKDKAAAASA